MKHRFAFALPLVAFVLLQILSGCTGSDKDRTNVLLIIVDALRADHLGCYGYQRDTSPVLDSLAIEGRLWTRVQAQSSWTLPGVSSIMTGLDARTHGAGRHGLDVFAFDPAIPTLATLLHEDGYKCAAFMNVYMLRPDFGFHHGYDHFRCNDLGNGMAALTVDSCIAWLDGLEQNESFLLTLHFFDVHDPYDPPAPYDTLFMQGPRSSYTGWVFDDIDDIPPAEELRDILLAKYDGEIRWVDTELGRLFSWLRERGLSSRTVVLVTADHGEEFLEHHGFGHGKTMFQEVLEIPLILSGPGIPPGSSDSTLACQLDIVPILLGLTGTPPPDGLQGIDLLSSSPDTDRYIPSSNVNSGYVPVTAAVRSGNAKVMWDTVSDAAVSFDLSVDPRETAPMPPDSTLLEAVFFYWATPPRGTPYAVERDRIQSALRDLGYI